jgi:hypothetical protein
MDYYKNNSSSGRICVFVLQGEFVCFKKLGEKIMKTTIKNFQIIVVLLLNTFAFAFLFFYSGIALAEEQKTQQGNKIAFVMHPYDNGSKYEYINSYRFRPTMYKAIPKIVFERILGGNKHIPNDADISFTQWGAEGQELWFLGDDTIPEDIVLLY